MVSGGPGIRRSGGQAEERWGTPASQSLRDQSLHPPPPETIVEPSGEKATEEMSLPCAFCFSATRSSEAEGEGAKRAW